MSPDENDNPDDYRSWLFRIREESQIELAANEERRIRLAEVTSELGVMRNELADAVDDRQALAEEILAMQRTRAWRLAVALRRLVRGGRNHSVAPSVDALAASERVAQKTSGPGAAENLSEEVAPGPTSSGLSLCEPPRAVTDPPSVSIIIPTKDRHDLLKGVLAAIAIADWPALEVVFVDNGTTETAAAAMLSGSGHAVVRDDGPFNFPRLVQRGVDASTGEVLLLLNNDIVTDDPHWVAALVECLEVEECGVAGAVLLTEDRRIQHCGISLTGGQPAHALAGLPLGQAPLDHITGIQPRTAVTGACMAIRRETWDALNGMDPLFGHNFNDIDLCLRARAEGLQVLCTAKAEIVHLESATRGPAWSPQAAADWLLFRSRWQHTLADRDPFLPVPEGGWAHGEAVT